MTITIHADGTPGAEVPTWRAKEQP